MGSCCMSAKRKLELFNHYSQIFDKFDFRLSPSDEFTFTQRAKRDLSFGYQNEDFINQVYSGYRNFMVKCCVELSITDKLNRRKILIAPFSAPPLVDEMWQLAILYTEKYRELCKALVGQVIYRVSHRRMLGMREVFKPYMMFYDSSYYNHDKNNTIWVKYTQIPGLANKCYDYLFSLKEGERINVRFNKVRKHLNELKKYCESFHGQKNYSKWNSPIPTSHVYLNGSIRENPVTVFNKIKAKLPPGLSNSINKKYCTGNYSEVYINEYCRFLTMLYFTNTSLTPSEEIDLVWHTHQAMSLDYEKFCNLIYGKIINHTPTTGGQSEDMKFRAYYYQTMEFYSFIFRESPIAALWPAPDDRFNPNNYQGCWISMYRMFTGCCRVAHMWKNTRPDNIAAEIAAAYYTWQGQHIFKKQVFSINLKAPGTGQRVNGRFVFWPVPSHGIGLGHRGGVEDDELSFGDFDSELLGDVLSHQSLGSPDSPGSPGSAHSAGNSGSAGGYSGGGYSGGGGDAGCSGGGGGDAGCSGGGGGGT